MCFCLPESLVEGAGALMTDAGDSVVSLALVCGARTALTKSARRNQDLRRKMTPLLQYCNQCTQAGGGGVGVDDDATMAVCLGLALEELPPPSSPHGEVGHSEKKIQFSNG